MLKEMFKGEQEGLEVFEPEYPQRTSTRFCFRALQQHNEPHFGNRYGLNHFAHVPKFILGRQGEKEKEKKDEEEGK